MQCITFLIRLKMMHAPDARYATPSVPSSNASKWSQGRTSTSPKGACLSAKIGSHASLKFRCAKCPTLELARMVTWLWKNEFFGKNMTTVVENWNKYGFWWHFLYFDGMLFASCQKGVDRWKLANSDKDPLLIAGLIQSVICFDQKRKTKFSKLFTTPFACPGARIMGFPAKYPTFHQ